MNKFKITSSSNNEVSLFDRQERIEWWQQEKLTNATVLVVGAGAIGNETLKNLALLGVGSIIIADFDHISTSNLSRTVLFRKGDEGKQKAKIAAERTKELALAQDFEVDYFDGDIVWDLGTGLYRHVDLVLGCLDNIETRLAVNKHCCLVNTPWIDAGIFELGLRVNFYNPSKPPCYQCGISPSQWEAARERYSCDDFKKQVVSSGKVPTVQIASALVAALQVQEAVKYLCGQEVAEGKQLYFQGKSNDFDVFSMLINDDCYAHQARYDKIISLDLGHQNTLHEFLTEVSKEAHSGAGAILDFRGDRTFVEGISCRNCQKKIELMRPSFRIYDYESICEDCRNTTSKKELDNIENHNIPTLKETIGQFDLKNTDERVLTMSLNDLGVPFLHILAVQDNEGGYKYYELSADKKRLFTKKSEE